MEGTLPSLPCSEEADYVRVGEHSAEKVRKQLKAKPEEATQNCGPEDLTAALLLSVNVFLVVLGIEPRAARMLGSCSTTEPHPQRP